MHAVARLMLHGVIDNIQVSWVKLGPRMARRMLNSGANDLGGTLMNETISRNAGALYGQEITPAEMIAIITDAGDVAIRRNTLYRELERYQSVNGASGAPLVGRSKFQTDEIAHAAGLSDSNVS